MLDSKINDNLIRVKRAFGCPGDEQECNEHCTKELGRTFGYCGIWLGMLGETCYCGPYNMTQIRITETTTTETGTLSQRTTTTIAPSTTTIGVASTTTIITTTPLITTQWLNTTETLNSDNDNPRLWRDYLAIAFVLICILLLVSFFLIKKYQQRCYENRKFEQGINPASVHAFDDIDNHRQSRPLPELPNNQVTSVEMVEWVELHSIGTPGSQSLSSICSARIQDEESETHIVPNDSINEEAGSSSASSVIVNMREISERSNSDEEDADNQDQTNVHLEFIEIATRTETSRMILNENDIEVITKIGHGNFGEVHLAVMKDDDGHFAKEVVVKTLDKDRFVNKKELQNAMREASIMNEFDHDNILTLIGVYFKNAQPVIVMPLMRQGNLLAYITNYQVNLNTLLQFAIDVAKGMRYLATKSMIHRDLAARNCLLDAELRVKVSDFGLTKHMISKTYYRCETRTQLPINWMAIESLRDLVFTTKTDVWSYGVLVWELMSGGQQPYDNRFSWEGLLLHLSSGQRLSKPVACPQPVYQLCMECWEEDSEQRPDFNDIIRTLIKITNAPVVDKGVGHVESSNYVEWCNR